MMFAEDSLTLAAVTMVSLKHWTVPTGHLAVAKVVTDMLLGTVLKNSFAKPDTEILHGDIDRNMLDAATDVALSDPRMRDLMLANMPRLGTLSRLLMLDMATRRIEELLARDDVKGATFVFRRLVPWAYLRVAWADAVLPAVDRTRFPTDLFDGSESLMFAAVARNVVALHRAARTSASGARLLENVFGRHPRLMARLDDIAECVVGQRLVTLLPSSRGR